MSDHLARVLQAELDAARPTSVPPFSGVLALRRRRLRRRALATVVSCAVAASGIALLPSAVGSTLARDDAPPVADDTDSVGEVGQAVPASVLEFGFTSFDAVGSGTVLTGPVRGVQGVGYRNAAGATCVVALPDGAPACLPEDHAAADVDQVVQLPVGTLDGDARGSARPQPVVFGYAPVGTTSVALQRGTRPPVQAQAHSADGLSPVSFFLAPFDASPVGPAMTFTAYGADEQVLSTRVQPAAASFKEASEAFQTSFYACIADKGFPVQRGPGGGANVRMAGPGVPLEQASALYGAAEAGCRQSLGQSPVVALDPQARQVPTGPPQQPVRVLPAGPQDSRLGTIASLPEGIRSDLRAGGAPADLLARTRDGEGSLYLVGVARGGWNCTTTFRDSPRIRQGGGGCVEGPPHQDLDPEQIEARPSWSSERPDTAVLEGSAPAGTTQVRIDSGTGTPLELDVSSAGPRWHERAYFIATVPRATATITALDADGNELAQHRAPAS